MPPSLRFQADSGADVIGIEHSSERLLILVFGQAVEKNAKERDETQSFLAEIPEKMEKIQRLSEIHNTSPELFVRANAVKAAIYVVLERIMNKITRTWKSMCSVYLVPVNMDGNQDKHTANTHGSCVGREDR